MQIYFLMNVLISIIIAEARRVGGMVRADSVASWSLITPWCSENWKVFTYPRISRLLT